MAYVSYAREAPAPVSLSVFNLVPDLLFDCSRVLEYAKVRTVLQSIFKPTAVLRNAQPTRVRTTSSSNTCVNNSIGGSWPGLPSNSQAKLEPVGLRKTEFSISMPGRLLFLGSG